MRAQLLDANGNKLLGPDGILVSNQPSGSSTYVFNACVDGSNNLIIGFQYESGSDMNAVVHKISQSGAQLWGSGGILLGVGLTPYPAPLSNGEVVVAWSESVSNTVNIQKITTGGTLAWTTPIAVTVSGTKTPDSHRNLTESSLFIKERSVIHDLPAFDKGHALYSASIHTSAQGILHEQRINYFALFTGSGNSFSATSQNYPGITEQFNTPSSSSIPGTNQYCPFILVTLCMVGLYFQQFQPIAIWRLCPEISENNRGKTVYR